MPVQHGQHTASEMKRVQSVASYRMVSEYNNPQPSPIPVVGSGAPSGPGSASRAESTASGGAEGGEQQQAQQQQQSYPGEMESPPAGVVEGSDTSADVVDSIAKLQLAMAAKERLEQAIQAQLSQLAAKGVDLSSASGRGHSQKGIALHPVAGHHDPSPGQGMEQAPSHLSEITPRSSRSSTPMPSQHHHHQQQHQQQQQHPLAGAELPQVGTVDLTERFIDQLQLDQQQQAAAAAAHVPPALSVGHLTYQHTPESHGVSSPTPGPRTSRMGLEAQAQAAAAAAAAAASTASARSGSESGILPSAGPQARGGPATAPMGPVGLPPVYPDSARRSSADGSRASMDLPMAVGAQRPQVVRLPSNEGHLPQAPSQDYAPATRPAAALEPSLSTPPQRAVVGGVSSSSVQEDSGNLNRRSSVSAEVATSIAKLEAKSLQGLGKVPGTLAGTSAGSAGIGLPPPPPAMVHVAPAAAQEKVRAVPRVAAAFPFCYSDSVPSSFCLAADEGGGPVRRAAKQPSQGQD